MDETANEYREPESTTYDQIASLADRNVVQVDSLQRNISELQAKKEDLDREISVMQKKMLHSMKAVEDAQITKSNSESSIKQLRQDILVKRETNAKSALVISALTKEIQDTKDALERKRLDFISKFERCSREISLLPVFSREISEKLQNGSIAGESLLLVDRRPPFCPR